MSSPLVRIMTPSDIPQFRRMMATHSAFEGMPDMALTEADLHARAGACRCAALLQPGPHQNRRRAGQGLPTSPAHASAWKTYSCHCCALIGWLPLRPLALTAYAVLKLFSGNSSACFSCLDDGSILC